MNRGAGEVCYADHHIVGFPRDKLGATVCVSQLVVGRHRGQKLDACVSQLEAGRLSYGHRYRILVPRWSHTSHS